MKQNAPSFYFNYEKLSKYGNSHYKFVVQKKAQKPKWKAMFVCVFVPSLTDAKQRIQEVSNAGKPRCKFPTCSRRKAPGTEVAQRGYWWKEGLPVLECTHDRHWNNEGGVGEVVTLGKMLRKLDWTGDKGCPGALPTAGQLATYRRAWHRWEKPWHFGFGNICHLRWFLISMNPPSKATHKQMAHTAIAKQSMSRFSLNALGGNVLFDIFSSFQSRCIKE
jgi:hypothetical protein